MPGEGAWILLFFFVGMACVIFAGGYFNRK